MSFDSIFYRYAKVATNSTLQPVKDARWRVVELCSQKKQWTGKKFIVWDRLTQRDKENFLKKGQVKFHKDLSFVLACHYVFNAVKCNLTELTTKSACVPLELSGLDTCAHVSENSTCLWIVAYRSVVYIQEAFSCVL